MNVFQQLDGNGDFPSVCQLVSRMSHYFCPMFLLKNPNCSWSEKCSWASLGKCSNLGPGYQVLSKFVGFRSIAKLFNATQHMLSGCNTLRHSWPTWGLGVNSRPGHISNREFDFHKIWWLRFAWILRVLKGVLCFFIHGLFKILVGLVHFTQLAKGLPAKRGAEHGGGWAKAETRSMFGATNPANTSGRNGQIKEIGRKKARRALPL